MLLTQAPLSPSGFAFATQLPDSAGFATQAPADGAPDPSAAPGAEAVAAASPPAQQRQQQHDFQEPGLQLQHHRQTASGEDSLQASVGHGDGADSGASRPRSGQSWLLSPLGALAQVFKRNATQVCGLEAGLARWRPQSVLAEMGSPAGMWANAGGPKPQQRPNHPAPCLQAKQGAGGPLLTQAPTQLPGNDTTSHATAAGGSLRRAADGSSVAPSALGAGTAAAGAAGVARFAARPVLLPSQCIGAGGDLTSALASALPSQRMFRPNELPSSRIPPGVTSPRLRPQLAAPSASAWNARPGPLAAAAPAGVAAPAACATAAPPAVAPPAAAPAQVGRAGHGQQQGQAAGALSPQRRCEEHMPPCSDESRGGLASSGSDEQGPGGSGRQSSTDGVAAPPSWRLPQAQQHGQQLSPRRAEQQQMERGQRMHINPCTPRGAQPLEQAFMPRASSPPLQPPARQPDPCQRRLSGGFLDILSSLASPPPPHSQPSSPLLPRSQPASPAQPRPGAVSPPSASEVPPGTARAPVVAAMVPAAASLAASAAPAANADRAAAGAQVDAAQVGEGGFVGGQPPRLPRFSSPPSRKLALGALAGLASPEAVPAPHVPQTGGNVEAERAEAGEPQPSVPAPAGGSPGRCSSPAAGRGAAPSAACLPCHSAPRVPLSSAASCLHVRHPAGSISDPAGMLGEPSGTLPPTQLVLLPGSSEEGPEQTSPTQPALAAAPEAATLQAMSTAPAAAADLTEAEPAVPAAPAGADALRPPVSPQGKAANLGQEQGPASAAGQTATKDSAAAAVAIAPGGQQQDAAADGVACKEQERPGATAFPEQHHQQQVPVATVALGAGAAASQGPQTAEQSGGTASSEQLAVQALEGQAGVAPAVPAATTSRHAEHEEAAPTAAAEPTTEAAAAGPRHAGKAAGLAAAGATAEAELAPSTAEGSPPEEALPTLQPAPSQWPESLLRERVPPTPAEGEKLPPGAAAVAAAMLGRGLEPHAAAASETAAVAGEEDGEERRGGLAAGLSGAAAAAGPQAGGLQQQMLAALDAEVQAAAAQLAAQEQALLEALAEAAPQAAAQALGGAAAALVAGSASPTGAAGAESFSFPALSKCAPRSYSGGRPPSTLAGSKRALSNAAQRAVGDLVEECRGPGGWRRLGLGRGSGRAGPAWSSPVHAPGCETEAPRLTVPAGAPTPMRLPSSAADVAQLLLQRSKRPRPAPREAHQPLGLRCAAEDEEAALSAGAEQAVPATHAAVQTSPAASSPLATAQFDSAGRPLPAITWPHTSAHAAEAQAAGARAPVQRSRLADGGGQTTAAPEERLGTAQAGRPQLRLVTVTSGVQTAAAPTVAAGMQTRPGVGMVAAGTQVRCTCLLCLDRLCGWPLRLLQPGQSDCWVDAKQKPVCSACPGWAFTQPASMSTPAGSAAAPSCCRRCGPGAHGAAGGPRNGGSGPCGIASVGPGRCRGQPQEKATCCSAPGAGGHSAQGCDADATGAASAGAAGGGGRAHAHRAAGGAPSNQSSARPC